MRRRKRHREQAQDFDLVSKTPYEQRRESIRQTSSALALKVARKPAENVLELFKKQMINRQATGLTRDYFDDAPLKDRRMSQ